MQQIMKIYASIAILGLFLWTPVYAQLPQSAQPFAIHWPKSIIQNLQKIGADVQSQSLVVGARENVLQLDSTKTFYGYGLPTPTDSTPLFRSIYAYPQPNVLIETNDQFENSWITLNRNTTFFDNLGRTVEVLSEVKNENGSGYRPDSRIESFPHDNSPELLDSVFLYQWDSLASDWLRLLASYNVYDANDVLLENISTFDFFGQPILLKDVYTYDANGLNTLVETFGVNGSFEIQTAKRELTYVDGRLSSVLYYIIDDNGIFIPQSRNMYWFNNEGFKTVEVNFEWDFNTNDWLLRQQSTFDYDQEQRLTVSESNLFNQDGTVEGEKKTYTYAQGDQQAVETIYLKDPVDGAFLLDTRKFFYYNGISSIRGPQFQNKLSLNVIPNPTTDFIYLDLATPAVVQIYSTQGTMAHRIEYQPGKPINLSEIPAGIYLIVAQSEQGVFSGRILKN